MRKNRKIIFISSAQVKLQDERKQLRELINKNDDTLPDIFEAKTFEDDLSGRRESVSEMVEEWVLKSDVYLGIFDRQHSPATEEEYYLAVGDKSVHKEIIILIRKRKKSERDAKLNIFLKKVKDTKGGHSCIFYSNQADLLTKVKKALMAYFHRSVEGYFLSQKMFGPKLDGLRGTNFSESLRRKLLKPFGRCINQTKPEPDNNSTSSPAIEMTRYGRIIKWWKNRWFFCVIAFVFVTIFMLGQFTDSINKMHDFWLKLNPSPKQEMDISNINSLTYKPANRKTQLNARIRKRVNELYDEIYKEKLKPWESFHIEAFQVTKYDGSVMPFGGIQFGGAPKNAFWMDDFIPPILENAIVKAFDQTIEECRANGKDPKPYVYETNIILSNFIYRVYNRMASIDNRLSNIDAPKNVPVKDVTDEIDKMMKCLKRQYDAALSLASEN